MYNLTDENLNWCASTFEYVEKKMHFFYQQKLQNSIIDYIKRKLKIQPPPLSPQKSEQRGGLKLDSFYQFSKQNWIKFWWNCRKESCTDYTIKLLLNSCVHQVKNDLNQCKSFSLYEKWLLNDKKETFKKKEHALELRIILEQSWRIFLFYLNKHLSVPKISRTISFSWRNKFGEKIKE